MTTEEKARAYDEALERAKKFHTPDSNNSNLKAVLELIFPQLKESEDERIRKNILTKMRACQKQSNFFSNDEIVWLEKHTLREWMILCLQHPELMEEFDKLVKPEPIK